MTASNLFVGPRAAYLISDQGAYDDDGTIIQAQSKVIISQRLKLAAILAGVSCVWLDGTEYHDPLRESLSALFRKADDQAAALRALPAAVAEALEETARVGNERTYVQVCLALWSEIHDRPEGYVIGSPGHSFSGIASFKLVGASGVAMPAVDRRFWPVGDVTRESARQLIREQRYTADAHGIHRVGVAAELVTVAATGVRSEVIERWPRDRLGSRIKLGLGGVVRSAGRFLSFCHRLGE